MQKRVFKNIIASFLVMLFTFSPIFGIEQAKAQSPQTQPGSYGTIGSYSYGSGGLSGGVDAYIKGLGPAITQLPLCKKKISSGISNLFSKSKALLKKDDSQNGNLGVTIDEYQAEADAIYTYDKSANKKLDDQGKEIEKITKSTNSLDETETCLDSIGRMVVKMMLQKITLSTVAWIQTGVNGGPAFVQNPGRFLRDIAKEEVLQFGLEINMNADCQATINGNIFDVNTNSNIDSTSDCVSPYAKSWFKSQAEAFNRKFRDNARYSLNEMIAQTTPEYTGADFRADFSAGGWNAWTALTSVPANNPIGFGLLAQAELSRRLEGTSRSTAEQIQESLRQSNGFLGDYRCADPVGLTRDQHIAALEAGQPGAACLRWEYVTPGKMVAEAATKVVNYQDNNLLKAEDLNDAVAAIVDALIQRFSNDLFQNGLAEFSNEGADGGIILNSYAIDGSYNITQVEQDYPEHLQGSNWLTENPNFNIRTDLTQAIIDEQRIYIQKLEEQNQVLERVIQWTRLLDYCIPGPSPKQYKNMLDVDLFSAVETYYQRPFDPQKAYNQAIVDFDPTGIFGGIASAILTKQNEKENKKIIATQLGLMFDIHIFGAYGFSKEQNKRKWGQRSVLNKDDMYGLGRNIVGSYQEIILKTYFMGEDSLAPMPLVTNESRDEFARLDAYSNIIAENRDRFGLLKAVTQRLGFIKEYIEDLGPVPSPSDPGYAAYEDAIKPYINEFGRLTSDMVTAGDVARANKMLEEMKDKEIYVKDDLLYGAGGCETEMMQLYEDSPLLYSTYYRRQPYAEPIPYLYGTNYNTDAKNLSVINQATGRSYFDPRDRTPWSEGVVKNWNPHDGFLYGAVYWNPHARPYDRGNQYNSDGKMNGPNLTKIREALADECPEFIDIVYFSYPSGATEEDPRPDDMGGLEPKVTNFEGIRYGDNNCGVITRRLEKLLNMY